MARSSTSAASHGIYVLSDLAYAEIYFDGNPPPSILQVPGARDIAVEFTSMSKTYSMAGWRIGFAVGNARLIAALARVKSYLDYGAFTPIQVAATAALNGPQDCVAEIARALQGSAATCWSRACRRRLGRAGAGGHDVRLGADPEGFRELGSLDFSKLLLDAGQCRGLAGRRLRRVRRGLCAHRAGREQAAHPPGASATSAK